MSTTTGGISATGVPPSEGSRLSTDDSPQVTPKTDKALSLYHLLDPEVLANPYPSIISRRIARQPRSS